VTGLYVAWVAGFLSFLQLDPVTITHLSCENRTENWQAVQEEVLWVFELQIEGAKILWNFGNIPEDLYFPVYSN